MYELVLLKDAAADRDRELRWSAERWGVAHARMFANRLNAALDALCEFPLAHTAHPSGHYRVVFCSGVRIPYHVDEAKHVVTVLAFVGRNRYHALEELCRQRTRAGDDQL